MLKLSTRGRYGARLMLDLALNSGRGPVMLRDIATRQEISEKYLWHLINPLKSAGLVSSTRGAHGGYTLAQDPSKITMAQIVSVLEGPIMALECLEDSKACSRTELCVTRDVWREVGVKVMETLGATTLQDLVARHHEKAEPDAAMGSYSI